MAAQPDIQHRPPSLWPLGIVPVACIGVYVLICLASHGSLVYDAVVRACLPLTAGCMAVVVAVAQRPRTAGPVELVGVDIGTAAITFFEMVLGLPIWLMLGLGCWPL